MTDYLEALLEALEEQEEREEVPETGEGAVSVGRERDYPPKLPAEERRETAGDRYGTVPAGQARRPAATLVRAGLAEALLAEMNGAVSAAELDGPAAVRGAESEDGLSVPAERLGQGAGSAAGLVRRLARSAAPPAAVPMAEVRVPEQDGPGGWDLAELDRRVERDARRYDGGLGMF